MKKLILIAAFMILSVSLGRAALLDIPKGIPGHLETSDYGGVSIATSVFSSATVLLSNTPCSIVGVNISSGATGPFIIFRDTTTLIPGAISGGLTATDDYQTGAETLRVYASTNSTNVSGQTTAGTMYIFPAPMRQKTGCAAKASSNLFNMITYFYTKFE